MFSIRLSRVDRCGLLDKPQASETLSTLCRPHLARSQDRPWNRVAVAAAAAAAAATTLLPPLPLFIWHPSASVQWCGRGAIDKHDVYTPAVRYRDQNIRNRWTAATLHAGRWQFFNRLKGLSPGARVVRRWQQLHGATMNVACAVATARDTHIPASSSPRGLYFLTTLRRGAGNQRHSGRPPVMKASARRLLLLRLTWKWCECRHNDVHAIWPLSLFVSSKNDVVSRDTTMRNSLPLTCESCVLLDVFPRQINTNLEAE